ncbi:uncharacterized protein RJT21DRAFT_544 [Scheffersomyces amazonensis]|uniref:uncharacterized protein n=1 Tax=Scheffersomyces amazonensis TaxID=1078765 RepID=UPI00315D28F7
MNNNSTTTNNTFSHQYFTQLYQPRIIPTPNPVLLSTVVNTRRILEGLEQARIERSQLRNKVVVDENGSLSFYINDPQEVSTSTVDHSYFSSYYSKTETYDATDSDVVVDMNNITYESNSSEETLIATDSDSDFYSDNATSKRTSIEETSIAVNNCVTKNRLYDSNPDFDKESNHVAKDSRKEIVTKNKKEKLKSGNFITHKEASKRLLAVTDTSQPPATFISRQVLEDRMYHHLDGCLNYKKVPSEDFTSKDAQNRKRVVTQFLNSVEPKRSCFKRF